MTPTLRPALPTALLLWLLPTLAFASGGGGHGGVDWVFAVSLFINFILFIVLVTVLLRRPIGSFFAGRADEIDGLLNQARTARDKAEATLRDYEAKVEELRATRSVVIEKARAEANAEQDRILAAARAQAQRLMVEAERTVAADYERARGELSREAARLVADEAEKLLRKVVREDDADRLADEYIDMLREVKS